MLPFKVSNKAVKVEGIPGIDGFVYLLPWSLGYYENHVAPRVLGESKPKTEKDSIELGRFLIASAVAMDETGVLAFTKEEPIDGTKGYLVPDQDHPAILDIPTPAFKGLTAAIWEKCGPRGVEEEKNASTPSPASG